MNLIIEPKSIKDHWLNKDIKIVEFKPVKWPETAPKITKAFVDTRWVNLLNRMTEGRQVIIKLENSIYMKDGEAITKYWLVPFGLKPKTKL